jgi:bifunctional non-homologous end joining protein LigD
MMATLTEKRFSDPGWIFERKFDGIRCLAFRQGKDVRLLTRNRLSANGRYPEVVEALAGQAEGAFIVDGEVVAFRGRESSFSLLQRRTQTVDPETGRRSRVRIYLHVFDVLHVAGYDVTGVQQIHRKALLRTMLRYGGALRYTSYRWGNGEAFWREACAKGWEGLIAKRADAPYEHRRSPAWLKFKCVNEQELVIGGFTEPQGSRQGFGALLVGYRQGSDFVYAGKVGTGFDEATLGDLTKRLTAIERVTPPFTRGVEKLPLRGVHWVKPVLVGQIGFAEWTGDGRLRHPLFLGLRTDKSPREVVREVPGG